MNSNDYPIEQLNIHPRAVIDIGAHIGESIDRFRRLWPEARIISFEPRPTAVVELRKKAEACGNCYVFPFGLGDKEGTLDINEFPKADGSSSFLLPSKALQESRPWAKQYHKYQVSVRTLDSVMDFTAARPYFIKVDVQGYEAQVIRGGLWTFAQASACIVEISHEELYKGGSTFGEIHLLLSSIGFQYRGPTRIVQRSNIISWADHLWANTRR